MKTQLLAGGLVLMLACGTGFAESKPDPAPAEKADVVQMLQKAGRFKTFLRALRVSGLTERFRQAQNITVFAPNDRAFAQLPPQTLQQLLSPANQDKLQAVLLAHVAKTCVDRKDLGKVARLDTLQGRKLEVKREDKTIRVDVAQVVEGEWAAEGLVVHEVNQVISP